MIGHRGERVTVGVDVGSSSIKVVAIDTKNHMLSSGEVSYSVERPGPGLAIIDADRWLEAAARAIQICLSKRGMDPGRVGALAVCGPAHNAALLDSSGRAVRPVIHWSDTRAAPQALALKQRLGRQILEVTLHPPMAGWTLAQFMWIRENHPESWKRATTWAVTKDYVGFKLTGELATDPYDATGTQMFDVGSGRWSPQMLGLLGWSPTENTPQVRASTAELGRVNSEASALTGLKEGTPVAVGTGDTMCEALASGAWSGGDVLIKLGSSGNVLTVAERPIIKPGVLNYPYLNRDKWIAVMATASGAASARWFRDAFLSGPKSPRKATGKVGYQFMDQVAETVNPGSDGLIFHPYLNGERSPLYDPDLRADFLGVTAAHSLPHFVRAIFEGVAMSLRHCIDDFGKGIAEDSLFSIVGGGARSPVWVSITAEVLGRQLCVGPPMAAAYGAALLARAMLSGEAPQPPDRRRTPIIIPDPDNMVRYQELMAIYRDSAELQQPISHRLSQLARDHLND